MQRHEVISAIMKQYAGKTPITKQGVEILYNRAYYRGYKPFMIYAGLKTVICKNYLRAQYEPPNGNPEDEPLHDKLLIEDWEFKAIMKGYITS